MKKLMLVGLLVATMPAYADIFPPKPRCENPGQPSQTMNIVQAEVFRQRISAYEKCIQRFVDEQREAVKLHTDAANDALRDYNRYVRGLR